MPRLKITDLNERYQTQIHAQLNADTIRSNAAQTVKPTTPKALVRREPIRKGNKSGVVVCVDLIAARHRVCDDDGNEGSLKWLRDAIAESIGLDDGDPRIHWRYGQIQTQGSVGVIVRIEANV